MKIKSVVSFILFLIIFNTTFSQNNSYCLFNLNSTEHSDTNAYLLSLCNYYIFPDLVGVKNYSDDTSFGILFSDKYTKYGMEQFSFINNINTSTNLVVMSNTDVIVVIFRGSETQGGFKNIKKDWIQTDAKCKMMQVVEFKNTYVHSGFWKSYSSIEDTLIKTIELHHPQNKKIFITGHSLGGALAVLAALDISLHNIPVFGVYTFANPRVGSEHFAEFYNQQNLPTFRYANENDIIPMLPPVKRFHRLFCPEKNKEICGRYEHVGITYNIKKDTKITSNDNELRIPNKIYKIGKIARHYLFEYCNKLCLSYFPNNDSLQILPIPPKK